MSEISLFQLGNFKSHSGEILPWKIACDRLRLEDWECLAVMLTEMIGPFGSVEGVPRGGIPFANAVSRYTTQGPLLIVDDVFTTGRSMEAHRAGRRSLGAVVFSRGAVVPGWVTPIFRMWE